jgi:hydroxymethylpyrimidine pyrophosphatase-like HAD family hydrolase
MSSILMVVRSFFSTCNRVVKHHLFPLSNKLCCSFHVVYLKVRKGGCLTTLINKFRLSAWAHFFDGHNGVALLLLARVGSVAAVIVLLHDEIRGVLK